MSIDLLHDNQPFLIVRIDGERRAATRPQRWMTLFDSLFDVLRIMVAAANDDQVLQTPGHVKLAITHQSEIFRAQEWTIAVGKMSTKHTLRLLRLVPVTLRHALARHPDLA